MPSQIDTLLRLVPDSPQHVLNHLQSHPELATAADTTGYSLLHAAASYNQLDILRTLVSAYHANINITDSDGETPLFVAETLATARFLVEELGADTNIRNEDGVSAEENALSNMEDGDTGEWADVADYLERLRTGGGVPVAPPAVAAHGGISAAKPLAAGGSALPSASAAATLSNGSSDEVHAPPPLPPNVRINMGTMREEPLEGEDAPDPEFRRRIEELAARDDFQSEAAQSELRRLVEDAVGGFSASGRDVRQRTE